MRLSMANETSPDMTTIVYAHDGESLYDLFFLNHLVKGNCVYLLTFSDNSKSVPKGVRVRKMKEPLHPTISPLTGLNTYLGSFLRTIILKYHLSRISHDVLIGCGGLSYGFYSALSRVSHYVLFIWGSDVVVAPRRLPFRFMAKYSLKKAKVVLVDSQVQEEACIKLGCDPRKIVKFPWVDPRPVLRQIEKNADSQGKMEEAFREKQGWKRNDPIIISTRHHEPIYNLECLIEAIPLVTKQVEDARFLIIGKGSLTEKLKRKVRALGVEKNVVFLGWIPQDEIPKYLKMSTIYVTTSLSDGTSASLIEAMTCRLPVVVTDTPGNTEWIKDGSNGLIFTVRDSKALAEKILRLLRDEDLGNDLAVNAYKTVTEKCDWQRNSRLLDNLISSVVTLK